MRVCHAVAMWLNMKQLLQSREQISHSFATKYQVAILSDSFSPLSIKPINKQQKFVLGYLLDQHSTLSKVFPRKHLQARKLSGWSKGRRVWLYHWDRFSERCGWKIQGYTDYKRIFLILVISHLQREGAFSVQERSPPLLLWPISSAMTSKYRYAQAPRK